LSLRLPSMNESSVTPLIDNLFRHEAGKITSVLTRIFGPHNLELAEDVVQDTLLKALDIWKFQGVPDNPSAWLFQVARNKALDVLRRERYRKEFARDYSVLLSSGYTASTTVSQLMRDHSIEDEQLRMMFVCCHPEVAQEAQVALILKTLCGFSVAEIAKAFLTNNDNIEKRLYRARQCFRERDVKFELPSENDIHSRLAGVHTAIYLLFSEGYSASHHDKLIRDDLVEEALRLGNMLSVHPTTALPETFALLALMCLQAARLYGRVDAHGNLLLLKQQDRKTWNRELILRGNHFLNRASTGDYVSSYHIEAAIAYEHCIADSYAETNWKRILQLYDYLDQIRTSAVVKLNRLIVYAEVHGVKAALPETEDLLQDHALQHYHLLYATLGEWHVQLGNKAKALQYFRKAIALSGSPAAENFLTQRVSDIEDQH
jgi:RNA polymerase sigma factor (sigma-70 family)